MMETKHTLTLPLKISKDGCDIEDTNGCGIVSAYADERVDNFLAEIVQAVNSHAALTSALDQCVEAIKGALVVGEIKFGTCVLARDVGARLKTALEQANKVRRTQTKNSC